MDNNSNTNSIDNSDIASIEAQIQELLKKKNELLEIEREKQKIQQEKEEAERLEKEKSQPCIIKVGLFSSYQLLLTQNVKRLDYYEYMRFFPRISRTYTEDIISIADWEKWKAIVETIPNITINISDKVKEHIEYYNNGPHAIIKLTQRDATVKVHPKASHWNVLGGLSGYIAKLNNTDGLYHLPKNELYKLLKISNDYKSGNIDWEKEALEYALKDLENRKLLDDISLAEDAPDFHVNLNGRELRPFQKVGVKFGVTTQKTIGNGNVRVLIADEMGLGKTWQAIAIVVHLKLKKVAVVCPASVKENWRREILNLTGQRAKIMKGTQPTVEDLRDLIDPEINWYIFNYDILSRPDVELKQENGMVEKKERYLWIEAINNMGITTVILDEAHKFKNTDAGRTKAILKLTTPNIIELTGTPVINRPTELWPGLHLLDKETFNNHDGFEYRYQNGNYGVRNVEELRDLLRPYMIRRKKLDVQKDLPPIIRTTQQVEMTEKQRLVYDKMMMSIIAIINAAGELEEVGFINHILVKILRLKQFLSKIKSQAVADFAIELYDQADHDDLHKKIILFSQFVPVVKRIVRVLGDESRYIIGAEHTPLDRQLIVDEFQANDKVQFLVATPQSTSEGLNITAAGHVVFCDYMWTPAIHQQAEGRAYGRLNDSHTIEAHYFAVSNSIDDWLRDILLQKLETIEQVVDGVKEQRVREDSIIKELIKAIKRGELR